MAAIFYAPAPGWHDMTIVVWDKKAQVSSSNDEKFMDDASLAFWMMAIKNSQRTLSLC